MLRRGLLLFCLLLACTSPERVSTCKACVATSECYLEQCVQMETDSVCARPCKTATDCASTEDCVPLTMTDGTSTSACIAKSGACGALSSGSTAGNTDRCMGAQGPNATNTCCHCGAKDGHCAPNNCYGGSFCSANCVCMPQPAGCNDHVTDAEQAGGPVIASIDPHLGGTTNRLHFAVVGDTRPANPDDTAHFPSKVITGIYADINALDPKPAFVVSTGDYVFASVTGAEAAPQFDLYLGARSLFSGVLWPTMGNHECTGYTNSNCGPDGVDGMTANYQSYATKMLAPIGETQPWYARRVDAMDGSWSAKFIFVSPNAWGATQKSWLQQQFQAQTTYTFVVRHEPSYTASQAPNVGEIDQVLSPFPITLLIEGHSHTWRHDFGSKELVVGNGGAPATAPVPFGYTIISQRSDNALVVTNYEYTANAPQTTFVVNPDGSLAN